MRLSYAPISLLQFFLISFLTLFLKLDVKAQSMLAVNSSRHHFDQSPSDNDYSASTRERYEGTVLDQEHSSTVNFLRSQGSFLQGKGVGKINIGYHPMRIRIYSASIQNSMHITVKLFKVVIVPLWCMRSSKY